MIKKYLCSTLVLVGLAHITNADVCKFDPGNIICTDGVIQNLSGNGSVNLNGTVIKGPTSVNGMLKAKNAEFLTLNINGSVDVDKCLINKLAIIKGILHSVDSRFLNSIDIYSSEIKFVNSSINGNLHVYHTDNKYQRVYLSGDSEVIGDIIFDDGHGEIIILDSAKVGGKIIGGNLINKYNEGDQNGR